MKKETNISASLPSVLSSSCLGCLLPYVTQHPLVGILVSSTARISCEACCLKHLGCCLCACFFSAHTLCT